VPIFSAGTLRGGIPGVASGKTRPVVGIKEKAIANICLIQSRNRSNWRSEGVQFLQDPTQNKTNIMKKLLTIAAVLALGSAAQAGCGKIETTEGTLKSFDKETKTLKVEGKDAKVATITLTPTTQGANLVDGLVGKSVKVDATHGKATIVAAK